MKAPQIAAYICTGIALIRYITAGYIDPNNPLTILLGVITLAVVYGVAASLTSLAIRVVQKMRG